MKKFIIIASVFALAFTASAVSAEEVTIEATGRNAAGETIKVPIKAQIKTISAEAKEKRDDIKSEIKTRKTDLETRKLKGNSTSTIATRLEKITDKSAERLSKELERFLKIREKIEARISKLEALGANASTSRALLAQADAGLDAAKTSIEAISAVDMDADDLRGSLEEIKAAVRGAQEDLKAGKKALMDVLPSMKGLQASIVRQATSTKPAAASDED